MNIIRRYLSNQIQQKLLASFTGNNVEVINESHLHSRGDNTHFKVIVVSQDFAGKTPVQRQRLVNKSLQEFWDLGVHSVSIHAFTHDEPFEKVPKSPHCKNKK
jgi:BolA family transcriptional regulator, general stress-responsive regulator